MTFGEAMSKLEGKKWETAIVVFSQSNWKQTYTKRERSYRISSKEKYFRPDAISSSLHGHCLNGKDSGVRLDLYRWDVDRVDIEM